MVAVAAWRASKRPRHRCSYTNTASAPRQCAGSAAVLTDRRDANNVDLTKISFSLVDSKTKRPLLMTMPQPYPTVYFLTAQEKLNTSSMVMYSKMFCCSY